MPKFEFNERRRRLEVSFDAKPSASVRTTLKERGFWWDGKNLVWWLAKPVTLRFVRNEPIVQDGFEWALRGCCDYLGLSQEEAEKIRKARSFACQQAAEMGMEEACGIR